MGDKSTTFEAIQEPILIVTTQSQWRKSVLTSKSEVLAYPNILDMAHEFGALLQFGTTYKLMEFLVTQQIKVSQRMTEEHAEQQMMERALTHTAESEDEEPLAKVGRKRNAGVRRVGIELPPLNTALRGSAQGIGKGHYRRQGHGDEEQKCLEGGQIDPRRATEGQRTYRGVRARRNIGTANRWINGQH